MSDTTLMRHGVAFPTSNVKVLHLTVDDFLGCVPCFGGEHGSLNEDTGRCACCSFPLGRQR